MKTTTLTSLLVIALVLAACQPATSIPPTATPTPVPPTYTPTFTLTPTITPTPTVSPGGFPRRFHVEGNAFVDQFGHKMIFRGLTSPDPVQMYEGGDPNMPAFNENYYQAMASWGATIIRVPITPYSLQHYGLDTTLRTLDQTIAWAGENSMYVIIDFHSVGWFPDNWFDSEGSKTTIEEWTGFWKAISSHYANNDVVALYQLFAEPALPWDRHSYPYPSQDWLTWKSLVENLLTNTIRPNDPDKIVLVGGLLSAYDLEYVAAAPIADISNNIAYTTDPYPDFFQTYHISWDTAFGDLSSHYPVFAAEYGFGGSNIQPSIDGLPYHQVLFDYLEAHSISWTVWNFATTWPPCLLKSYWEPSESGTYFRSLLLELNFPGVPTPLPPTPYPTPTGRPGNLAYGKPAIASSIKGIDYLAENAVDGNLTTVWASEWSDPQWFQVDLGDSYRINEVVLNWSGSFAVVYKIQISSDGSNWETIYATTSGDGEIDDLNVTGSGRYVRMYGTSRNVTDGNSYSYRIAEFEVYGVP
jgi:endoglucanase